LDQSLEEYLEIPSSSGPFDFDPWMKAAEITAATIHHMANKTFDFGRINLANGDMVGHTGNFEASVLAVSTVDLMLSKLLHAAKRYGYSLVITADHGNADDMYLDSSESPKIGTESLVFSPPKAKTAHSLSPVPLYVWGQEVLFSPELSGKAGLANLAATVCRLMGLPVSSHFQESLIK
jgi:2,3-bisphosphoglycerate-independent phosphoglycerate mutase